MSEHDTICYIIKNIVVVAGQISVLIFGYTAIYLGIKYKTLAFWDNASKKEMVFVKIGFVGFLIFGALGIVLAIFSDGN